MMKLRMACLLGLSLLALAAVPAVAQMQGEFALGFNSTDAPVGVRYFASDKVAIDAGIGLESMDLGKNTATSFFLEAGVYYVLYDYQSTYFFVRPAVAFASLDDRAYGTGAVDAKWTVIEPQLNLGAEVRLADHFGLTFQHGLRVTLTSLPDEIVGEGEEFYSSEDSFTDFSTFGENVTEAGVWFTF